MKKFSELFVNEITNEILSNHLINDLYLALECHLNYINHLVILEYHGTFVNYDKVVTKITEEIMHVDKTDDDIRNETPITLNIDCSKCDSYCKHVDLTLVHTIKERTTAELINIENDNIKFSITLNIEDEHDPWYIQGIILHELLHGYEDYERKKNGKLSIFDEITDEYKNAKRRFDISIDTEKYMITLKYFFRFT